MTTTDTERIAEQLRADLEAPSSGPPALASMFAETVELRHAPPTPTDGPVAGSLLREQTTAAEAAFSRAMPDRTLDDLRIDVEGDTIHIQGRMRGTLGNGTSVDLLRDQLLEIRDGQVVIFETRLDDRDAARTQEVLTAGGFDYDAWAPGDTT
jgi:hypothetical protein